MDDFRTTLGTVLILGYVSPESAARTFRKSTAFKVQGIKGKLVIPTGSQYTSFEGMISMYMDR